MKLKKRNVIMALFLGVLSANSMASDNEHHGDTNGAICKGFGPQTPRDIDETSGKNKRLFAAASSYKKMNLLSEIRNGDSF